ncbi:MAG: hypothetical protein WC471_04250 [Candidatus Woesearchaeota archaeon]
MVERKPIKISDIQEESLKKKYHRVRAAVRNNLKLAEPLDLDAILEDSKLEKEIGEFIAGFTKYCHEKDQELADQCMWWLTKYCEKYKMYKMQREMNSLYRNNFGKDYVHEEA